MAAGQRRLDIFLPDRQPVEGAVELLLVDRAEAELGAEAGGREFGESGARAAASFEPGSRTRLTVSASTRSRQRSPAGPMSRSRPILRAVPRAAPTWPCGDPRSSWIASWSAGMTTLPFNSALKPADILLARPVGQVQQRALLDLAALAVALAQEDRRGRIPVPDRFRCTWPHHRQ